MPLFAIHCLDNPGAEELRARTRSEHLRYLGEHAAAIFAAGPLLGLEGEPIGSLIIIRVAERREAYGFAADDPYSRAGLFQSVAITEWRKILPE